VELHSLSKEEVNITWIPAPRLRGDRLSGYDAYGICLILIERLGIKWPRLGSTPNIGLLLGENNGFKEKKESKRI
jgi:hypothetical protein